MEQLFVYGTLAPGRQNAHLLERIGGTWQAGTIRGTLHPEGWGATLGYPALVLDDGGEEVSGFVFRSARLAASWQELDDFEGEGYRRTRATVQLDDGTTTMVHVYVLAIDGSS